MTTNKTVVVTLATSLALILLIAWGFYHTLQPGSGKIKVTDYPPKAVMAQAQATNETRLDKLAQSGKVTKGMDEKQVRDALGEPARTEQIDREGERLTVWWYEHEGWMSVTFDDTRLVYKIDKQP